MLLLKYVKSILRRSGRCEIQLSEAFRSLRAGARFTVKALVKLEYPKGEAKKLVERCVDGTEGTVEEMLMKIFKMPKEKP